MEQEVYLGHYRVCLDDSGAAITLHSGAGAATYKAEDTTTGREVIVQVVPVAGLRLAVREKLEAEALAAKQINHPTIPALCDFGLAGDEFVYVTEYFDGTSAHAWVTEHGPLPIGAVLRIASQMVGALGAATFHGIFHHALNPGNVMLVPGQTPEGDWPLIKVVSFLGLAPSFAGTETSGAGLNNLANYASPEQLQDGAVDFRSEIYSLGCTLWFLFTGAAPLAGAVTVENASGVPGPVRHLIAQMLEIDPSERQLDPLALQEQIQDCLARVERRDAVANKFGIAPVAAAPAPAVIGTSSRRPISWKPLALAALLLAAATLAALVLPRSFRSSRLFTRGAAPIGVPIGIPTAPSAPSTDEPAIASTSAAPSSPTNEPDKTSTTQVTSRGRDVERMNDVVRQIDRFLVSTASADDDPAHPSEDSRKIAENTAPVESPAVENALQESAANIVDNVPLAARAPEPPPPSEGPEESSAPPASSVPETTALAEATTNAGEPSSTETMSSAPTPPPRIVSQESAAPLIASGPSSKSARLARTTKRSSRARRYASATDARPSFPAHSVRAQYLGTTQNGDLVFGLPSSERVFASPVSSRVESPRRRARRVIKDPISELPVLPALPPDE